jgi:hypothetical protein
VFAADAWTPLQASTVDLMVRPRLNLAPTLIIPPMQNQDSLSRFK